MINFTGVSIGDEVYYVNTNINFNRPKITMIDIDGVQWMRREEQVRSYEIEKHTLVGTIIRVQTGNCGPDTEYNSDDYFLKNAKGDVNAEYVYKNERGNSDYFLTLEAAQVYINELTEKDRKIDLQ